MSFLRNQDLQNSRVRRAWIKNKLPAIALAFGVAAYVDLVDNTLNKRIIAPLFNTPVNATSFTEQSMSNAMQITTKAYALAKDNISNFDM